MWINIVVFSALSYVYAKNALHMFQQNRYEFYRYTKWLFNRKNIRFNLTVLYALAAVLLAFFADNYYIYVLFLVLTIVFAIYQIYRESKHSYIKPLVYKLTGKTMSVNFFALYIE